MSCTEFACSLLSVLPACMRNCTFSSSLRARANASYAQVDSIADEVQQQLQAVASGQARLQCNLSLRVTCIHVCIEESDLNDARPLTVCGCAFANMSQKDDNLNSMAGAQHGGRGRAAEAQAGGGGGMEDVPAEPGAEVCAGAPARGCGPHHRHACQAGGGRLSAAETLDP